MGFTADNVIFGYRFNKLAFTVPTPYVIDENKANDFTSVSRDSGVASSVFTSVAHGLAVGERFEVKDGTNTQYCEITAVTADTFTAEVIGGADFTIAETGLSLKMFGRYFSGNTFFQSFKMTSSLSFTFVSTQAQKVSVAWGDGTFEDLSFIVGSNTVTRREHEYFDGLNEHNIEFSFEKPESIQSIATANVDVGAVIPEDIKKFTNLEELNFGRLSGIEQFPQDLSSLTKLKSLTVRDANLPKIDDSVFTLPLTFLNLQNSLDFTEANANASLQKLGQLALIESINLNATKLTEFPADFANRLELDFLSMGGNNLFTTLPINIPSTSNQGLETLNLEDKNPQLTSYQNFDRLLNLRTLQLRQTFDNINLPIGNELGACTKLKTVTYRSGSVNTQAKTDAITNNWYDFIVTRGFGDISGAFPDFREMAISLKSHNGVENRPSGTYEAPPNFVKGSANGDPTTPMHRMYILVENYLHTWEVGDGTASFGTQTFTPTP